MKRFDSDTQTVLVLKRGEEIVETLTKYVSENHLTAAWISGLGGASSITIAWYDITTKKYIDRTIDDALEILNLTGNISIKDNEPFLHLHGTFAGSDYGAVGGHVKSLTVGLTCEIVLTKLIAPLTRNYDGETGLHLL